MRGTALALALLCAACTARDRVVLDFDDASTRAEATRAEVYALALETRGGLPVDCDALRERRRRPDDGEVVVVQRTRLELPLAPDASPLLVQLPQDRYLFFAEAFDRFGFRVAHGCTVDDVTSARRLELHLALATEPALEGELTATGPTERLQHAGLPGLETAQRLEVQALGPGGLLTDVEVRTLIEDGEGVVVDPVLRSDAQGRAGSALLIGAGPLRALVHVRGLRGSPVAFALEGLPSPTYASASSAILAEPIALLADDFVVDTAGGTDLMAVMRDAGGAHAMVWRADPQGSTFGTGRRYELDADVVAIVSGHLDRDDRTDLVYAVPAATAGELPALRVQHHSTDLGDAYDPAIDEALPSDLLQIRQVLTGHVEVSPRHDVVVVGQTASARVVLLYLTRDLAPNDGGAALALRQRFELPDFIDDAEVQLGDLDSDGDDDLLLSSSTFGHWIVPCGRDAEGHGSSLYFVPPDVEPADWPHLFATIGTHLPAVRDLDEDGLNDLLVVTDSSALGAGVGLRLARGTGRLVDLAFEGRRALPVDSVDHLVVEDLNADGHLDLLINAPSAPRRAILMGGDGSGELANPLALGTDLSAVAVAVADLNLDGVVDAGFLGTLTCTDASFLVQMSTGLAR